ncbi:MAG: twitch domain-containing radical SAM protein [Bacteriovoracaceae bacterium]|nr:twitch domain-containing radical SAM protein [Bacteriovoracaceae bacterium]
MSEKKPSQYFCIAPWTHTYLSPQAERRLCCASREKANWQRQYIDAEGSTTEKFDPLSLKEHWNSEHMKSVRKRILDGENIPECQVCNHNILNLYTYRDYFTKTLFPQKVQQALESTDETGFTTMEPISFDYRISNVCSFKCRMCGELFSSAWEAEKRAMNQWDPERDRWMLPENKKLIENFQVNVAEPELWEAAKSGKLEEIYWVGGEPLAYQIHWDIMKYLVETDQASRVTVRYNTNLNRISQKGVNLFELLPKFKNVNMCCSIDATGEIGEWVRSGLNWENWLRNFKSGLFLTKLFGMDAMVMDVTLTLPGMFDVKNLIKLAVDLRVKTYVKITFDFDSAIMMSPMALPRKILNRLCDELIEFEKANGNQYTRIYTETFESMKTRPNFEEKYPDWKEGQIEGKHRLQKIAKYRGDNEAFSMEKILSQDAEVLNWWSSINEKV